MRPLDIPALKQTADALVSPRKRSSGLVAAIFMFLTDVLIFTVTFPLFREMQKYDLTAAALPQEAMTLSAMSDLINILLSLCFSAVFSFYCLKLLHGAPSDGKTLLKSFTAIPKILLPAVVTLAAIVAAAYLYSVLIANTPVLGMLFLLVLCLLAFALFYVFRLYLFSLADQDGFHPIRAMKECIQLTEGRKKTLFFLDLSFVWFSALTGLVFFVFSAIPDALLIFAENFEKTALAEWVETNYLWLSYVCSVIGFAAEVPLYYRFYTKIQLTFALAYESLKKRLQKSESTQPLAYMEFDPPEDDA